MKLIFAVLDVSLTTGLTRCYKNRRFIFTFISVSYCQPWVRKYHIFEKMENIENIRYFRYFRFFFDIFDIYTGWAKKPDHFLKCMTLVYDDV